MDNILKNICSLIRDFMKLDNEHIYIYNNKWFIPEDKGLCVVVGCQNIQVLSNNCYYEDINNNFQEVLENKNRADISINIFSYNNDALYRKEEILMALNSTNSVNIQDKNGFKIFRLPNAFNNASEQDGTKILNRYIINFSVLYNTTMVNNVNYYNNYNNKNIFINN